MTTTLKPLTLWGHVVGPNPWKVSFCLDELNIPYEHKTLNFDQLKKSPYEDICVNGRLPTLEDPNTGITLWESGAILEYIVETYDKKGLISFESGTPDYFKAKQWLHFQVSGQGPYFGQAIHFGQYHSEPLPSATERYVKEVRRVTEVLNRALEGKTYLVGEKFSYADLAFLPWFLIAYFPWFSRSSPGAWSEDIKLDEFPNTATWLRRIQARPATSKSLEQRFQEQEKQAK